MLHVVLHNPKIPPNTGNIIRLAANVGFELHLIEPLAQDTAETVNEIEDKLKKFEKEQNDQDQKIVSIETELENKQGAIDRLCTELECLDATVLF